MDATESEHAKTRAHETQVVGALIQAPRFVDDVSEIVTPEDFYTPSLAAMYEAICQMRDRDQPIDALSVADQLQREGVLSKVGGYSAVHEVVADAGVPGSAPWHAQRVRDAALLRAAGGAADRIRALVAEGSADEQETLTLVDGARAELDALANRDTGEVDNPAAVWAAISALDDPSGDDTPWANLTRAVAGWQPRKLYVVAARPGGGKSIFGVQAVHEMAKTGKTGILFSMEMGKTEIYHRILSREANVDMGLISHRALGAREKGRMNDAARGVAGLGGALIVDDRAKVSLAQMRARVRAAKRKGEVGLVVVDYLGLVRPSSRSTDRRVQVDEIAQGLKELAMDCQVPVVALSQLRRLDPGADGKTRKPVLGDLRESGGIENAADMVLLLHRDEADETQGREMTGYVAKNRSGPQGVLYWKWDGAFSRIMDLGEDDHHGL